MTDKKDPHVVIVMEMALPLSATREIAEAVRTVLEIARQWGVARVVSSYETTDDPMKDDVWMAKAITDITIGSPVTIEVDYV